MKVEIKFRDDEARRIEAFLRVRYESRAELPKLAKIALRELAAMEAKKVLGDVEEGYVC